MALSSLWNVGGGDAIIVTQWRVTLGHQNTHKQHGRISQPEQSRDPGKAINPHAAGNQFLWLINQVLQFTIRDYETLPATLGHDSGPGSPGSQWELCPSEQVSFTQLLSVPNYNWLKRSENVEQTFFCSRVGIYAYSVPSLLAGWGWGTVIMSGDSDQLITHNWPGGHTPDGNPQTPDRKS